MAETAPRPRTTVADVTLAGAATEASIPTGRDGPVFTDVCIDTIEADSTHDEREREQVQMHPQATSPGQLGERTP